MSLSLRRLILLCSLLSLGAAPARGDDGPSPATESKAEKQPEKQTEKQADKQTGNEASEPAQPPREQTIYIPYEKLRQTFEKDGRGVFIPYDRFQELWKAAQAKERKPAEVKPPTPAVITLADNEATVGKEVVRVRARLKIDLLASGWVEVPLRLEDAGVISATLVAADGSEEPARLAATPDGGYKLIIENKTKGAHQIELRLEYAKPFNKTPGRNEVSFAAPQAPINRWKVRVPERGAKVHVEPMIAATESPVVGEVHDAKSGDGKQKNDPPAADEKNRRRKRTTTRMTTSRSTKPCCSRSSERRQPCESIGPRRPKALAGSSHSPASRPSKKSASMKPRCERICDLPTRSAAPN